LGIKDFESFSDLKIRFSFGMNEVVFEIDVIIRAIVLIYTLFF